VKILSSRRLLAFHRYRLLVEIEDHISDFISIDPFEFPETLGKTISKLAEV